MYVFICRKPYPGSGSAAAAAAATAAAAAATNVADAAADGGVLLLMVKMMVVVDVRFRTAAADDIVHVCRPRSHNHHRIALTVRREADAGRRDDRCQTTQVVFILSQ